jgi:hypothetical protein
VMVSFGEDKIDSGSLFIPNAPYFLSVFLGAHEQEGRAYTDVSTLFRTQNPTGFQSLLIGQWSKVTIG